MDQLKLLDLREILIEFKDQVAIKPGKMMVIGCSTSEIAGERIGSNGSTEIAEKIFIELQNFADETGVYLAFQCCEHLNRALVVERSVLEKFNLDEVSVVPHPKAGGAMASYAYRHFKNPCIVEFIKADYGLDIGDTLIGMHLKQVAVPVRVSRRTLGKANITLATTRPKLIGGQRAIYCL